MDTILFHIRRVVWASFFLMTPLYGMEVVVTAKEQSLGGTESKQLSPTDTYKPRNLS